MAIFAVPFAVYALFTDRFPFYLTLAELLGLVFIFVISQLILRRENISHGGRSKEKQIKNPPANFLLKIANFLPERFGKDLEQNISDMRLEYYEALSEKKTWRARFIVAFYYVGLGWSAVMWISHKAKEVVGIVPKTN